MESLEAAPYLETFGRSCAQDMDFNWYPAVELNVELSPGRGMSEYPEGMAYPLKPGTPIMFQSHHLNPLEHSVLVQDQFDLYFKPIETLDNVAAPVEVGDDYFEIPAQSRVYPFI